VLTIFTAPKAFHGPIALIQRNAIRSWLALRPMCEILLCGDDRGTAEAAAALGVVHVPEVARNEYGTPLVDSLFLQAERRATQPWLCYVNCDIILMSDFSRAVAAVSARQAPALMICRRWDLDVTQTLDFRPGWEQRFAEEVRRRGRRRPHTALDCFVFSRGLWTEIPPFALGRGMWDNWLVYEARAKRLPVVDLSEVVLAVHQNHDYRHQAHPVQREADVWTTREARRNFELGRGYARAFTAYDATHVLTRRGLRRNITPYSAYRSLALLSESCPILDALLAGARRAAARLKILQRMWLWRVRW
jgi:hypothetical protein